MRWSALLFTTAVSFLTILQFGVSHELGKTRLPFQETGWVYNCKASLHDSDYREANEYMAGLLLRIAESNPETFQDEYHPDKVCIVVTDRLDTLAGTRVHTRSIFIHPVLFLIMENEAQVVAVLTHELAHITRQHGLRTESSRNLRGRPVGYQRELTQNDETEADEVGFEFYLRAGYRADQFDRMLAQLIEGEDRNCLARLHPDHEPAKGNQTHPHPCWRVWNIRYSEWSAHQIDYLMHARTESYQVASESQFAFMKTAIALMWPATL